MQWLAVSSFKIYVVILQQSENNVIDVEVVNVNKCSLLPHSVSQNIKSFFEEYGTFISLERGIMFMIMGRVA